MSTEAGTEGSVRQDAELIVAVRGGDVEATGQLYERHAGAALVVARRYTDSTADAEDVVADSFTAVFLALQRGNGPDSAFRAYLFTVVRRVAGLQRTRARRVEPTDDVASLEAGTVWAGTADEPALEGFEHGVVARAFHGLPERWQAVLWHTEVEGLAPAQIAPILGLTANGVAALAYRAREGLRQAYLQEHLRDPLEEGCRAVAGKLGSYVRGGLGTRENAQVERHLDGCGECRALVLELTDVNHGMRAVIAPLVLGLAGMGALAHLLPVGGGLAAGAALAAGHGQGAATTAATAGAGGAAAVAAGGGATAGAGAAASAGAATGIAAFISSIPVAAAAVVAGTIVLAGVATAVVVGLLSGPDAATPAPSTSASSTLDQPVAGTTSGATPTPSATASAQPTAAPTAPPVLPVVDPAAPTAAPTDEPTTAPTDEPTTAPTDEPTAAPTSAPTDTPTPEPTDEPTSSPTAPPPPPPDPAALSVVLPATGLDLEAGADGQELGFEVANTGGTAATGLAADVVLPDGVSIDSVLTLTTAGVTGRFAPAADPGWVCTGTRSSPRAHCTLDALAPGTTARLVLRVSVDESYDRSDGSIELHVTGAGLDFQAAPIPVRVAPAPARLALASPPAPLALLSGRPTTLTLPLRNAGGEVATAPVARVAIPDGIAWEQVAGAWTCSRSQDERDGDVAECTLPALAARASAPLVLSLTAGDPGDARTGSIGVTLTPSGRSTPPPVAVPYTVQLPARLSVTAPRTLEVLGGHAVPVELTLADVGDLDASRVAVVVAAPEGTSWGSSLPTGWECAVDGLLATCTRDELTAGASTPLVLDLIGDVGATGKLGSLEVTARALGADAAEASVPVVGRAPDLTVRTETTPVLVQSDAHVQVQFAVDVGPGSDAGDMVARVVLPRNVVPDADGSPSSQCAATEDAHVVECPLGDVAAGGSAPVLVEGHLLWSEHGDVTVTARAAGATSDAVQIALPASSAGLVERFTGTGDVTQVGAPLLSCNAELAACRSALEKGTADNNGLLMGALDEAPAPKPRAAVAVSSSATLDVPKNAKVEFAGLYWSANASSGDPWSKDLTSARLRAPGSTYESVTGTVIAERTDNAQRRYYQSFADVTEQVATGGSGSWSVADVAVSAGRSDKDPTYFAGWALVVVYADGSDSTVSLYDSGAWVGSGAQPPVFSFAAPAGTWARVGVVAWEGDYTSSGDQLRLTNPLCDSRSTPLTPVRWDNAYGSSSNAFDSTATGWRAPNSLGTDAKPFAPVRLGCDVSSLTASTTGDQYMVGAITLRTEPAVTDQR